MRGDQGVGHDDRVGPAFRRQIRQVARLTGTARQPYPPAIPSPRAFEHLEIKAARACLGVGRHQPYGGMAKGRRLGQPVVQQHVVVGDPPAAEGGGVRLEHAEAAPR